MCEMNVTFSFKSTRKKVCSFFIIQSNATTDSTVGPNLTPSAGHEVSTFSVLRLKCSRMPSQQVCSHNLESVRVFTCYNYVNTFRSRPRTPNRVRRFATLTN